MPRSKVALYRACGPPHTLVPEIYARPGFSSNECECSVTKQAVALSASTQHNWRMLTSPWQRRIQRSHHLAARFAFAAEILRFYEHLAAFQEELNRRLSAGPAELAANGRGELSKASLDLLVPEFREFLQVCEQYGPARTSELSADLCACGTDFHATLIHTGWAGQSPLDAAGLLAQAFLQPYAELIRSRAELKVQNYSHAICPFCDRKPTVGVLRPLGEGAARSLICAFCLIEWEFRRIICAACGEQDADKLPVYSAAEFEYIRVECCDTCKIYIKTVDLSKDGHAEPVVDELASVPLDLWARDHGYAKLQCNLLGL